jgi:F420-dependent oxidoreductase-like protein
MQVGVHICTFDWEGGPAAVRSTLADIVRDTEAAGFHFVTFMDHFMQAEGFMPPPDPIIEGYSALSYAAALTERVTLGMLVTGVLFRNPGVLAKTVTTLDVLSGGRAMLGIGGAWYAREHAAMGIEFPAPGERLDRLEEAIEVCLQTWSDDDGPFRGRYYDLAETMCSPPALSQPHPPIMVGGGGEKRTLRVVARYADIWNIASFPVDAIKHKLEVLRAHGDAVGRDTDAIRKTILWMNDPRDDEDEFRRRLDDYSALGFDTVFVMPYGSDPRGAVAWLAEVMQRD